MAEVFRAKITSSHGFEKILVIKRILPHLAADPNFVAMFIDEAKLTAQLTHPKIVQVLEFGEVRGQFFIALEYVDGFDALGLLRVAAQKRVHVPRSPGGLHRHEVLDALDYAHNARDMDGKPMQIVHRDISPSNIFISKRGDVKLGDFGIAHAQRRESKTQAGTLKGKYGYMSPEQVVGRPIDARSDLFAVGVVLAELLTGRRLFTAPADLDVLLMVRDVKLERLDKYGADLPKALDRIVRQALLKKNPRERFASAAEFREALADYLFSSGQRVGPDDLRTFTGTLFDTSPDAAARLLQDARRMETPKRRRQGRGRGRRRARAPSASQCRPVAAAPARRPPAAAPGAPADADARAPTSCRTRRPPRPQRRPARAAGPRTRTASARRRPGSRRSHGPAKPRAGGPAARRGRPATHSDVGRFVSARAEAAARQRGRRQHHHADAPVLRSRAGRRDGPLALRARARCVKEIFLVGGSPESVSSSNANERFGEYLVGKQVLGHARPRARAQHAAPLQRQARRHAGRARPAPSARRIPAAVRAGARPRDRRVRVDRGNVRVLPRRHQPPGELPARPRHVRDPRRQRGQPAATSCSSSGSTRCSTTVRSRPGAAASSRRRFASARRRARC